MQTEYRIRPVMGYGVVNYYLQYKCVKKWTRRRFLLFGPIVERQSVSWHDIPYDRYGMGTDNAMWSYDFNKYELVDFTERWPDVRDYFDDLDKRRQKYREDYAGELRGMKIEYL